MNRVTIFSNGLADFTRTYKVQKNKPIQVQIPVKKDHVGDVLASLNSFPYQSCVESGSTQYSSPLFPQQLWHH